jgi:DNA-directed RNA polymerase specialized sigma24 family protein
MATTNINVGDERGRRLEQVFDKYRPRLRRYFLVQLGDGVEADSYARETVHRLFDFMKGHQWEREADYINGYLMRIAFDLCSYKQAEQNLQGEMRQAA